MDQTSWSVLIAIACVVFALSYKILHSLRNKSASGYRLPPALPSIPFLGSLPYISNLADLPEFFKTKSKTLGPIFSVKLGTINAVILNELELIRDAFIKKGNVTSDRFVGHTSFKYGNPSGLGILTKNYGAEFRRIHKAFHAIINKEFGLGSNLMNERIRIEAEELIDIIGTKDGKEFCPHLPFMMCTLNVIASIAFGERGSQTDPHLIQYAKDFEGYINAGNGKRRKVDYCPMLEHIPSYKKAIKEAMECQKRNIEFVKYGIERALKSDKPSFVKMFLEREGEDYNRMELQFIIRDMLSAGFETTANTLQWLCMHLANDQSQQKKIQEQIDEVCLSGSYPAQSELPLVEAAILEALRIKTVVPLGINHKVIEDIKIGDYDILKDTVIISNIHAVHMDETIWQKPKEFRPERFLDSNGKVTDKDKIIPFSVGRRSCIGEYLARQELYIFVTALLANFTILPPEGVKEIICEAKFSTTYVPVNLQLRMIRRKAFTKT